MPTSRLASRLWPVALPALLASAAACGGDPAESRTPTATPKSAVAPAPRVSPANRLTLRPVWNASLRSEDTVPPVVAGSALAAPVRKGLFVGGPARLALIDPATGKTRATVTQKGHSDNTWALRAATDERGRPRIRVRAVQDHHETVFDPSGRVVWQSPSPRAEYIGGYAVTFSPTHHAPRYTLTLRDLQGHAIARLPNEDDEGPDNVRAPADGIVAARPGLLALAAGDKGAELLDVRKPRSPREIPLAPPRSVSAAEAEAVASDGTRAYVLWDYGYDGRSTVVAYDLSHGTPVWRSPRPDRRDVQGLTAAADPGGDGAVLTTGEDAADLLNARTGKRLGPHIPPDHAVEARLVGASAGRIYVHEPNVGTRVIDGRSGKLTATIDWRMEAQAVTRGGDLIVPRPANAQDPGGLVAYSVR